MLFLQSGLMWGGIGMILVAAGILGYDLHLEMQYQRAATTRGLAALPPTPHVRWRTGLALVLLAWAPILLVLSIVVVASGQAGV